MKQQSQDLEDKKEMVILEASWYERSNSTGDPPERDRIRRMQSDVKTTI
jgi:hypothetical protein